MYIWFPYNTPSLLSIIQEITNYDVAASKLLNLLCLIIDGIK